MFKSLFGVVSIAAVAAWFVFFLGSSYYVFNHHSQIYAEDGLIENIQASFLAIACLVYLAVAVLDKKSKTLILLFCSLLCYGFVLRELDVEKLNVPSVIKLIGSGVGRNASVGAAFVAILIYVGVSGFTHHIKTAVAFFKTKSGLLLLAAAVFLFVGEFFEKQTELSFHVFYEEMFELLGYIFILLSSFSVVSFMNKGESRADKGVAV